MIDKVISCLSQARLPLAHEKDTQRHIGQALERAGVVFTREVQVAGGIIDFMIGDVGLEVKIKGTKRQVYRQMAGYAEEPSISTLILATSLAMGLPAELNGKRVHVLELGRAWL